MDRNLALEFVRVTEGAAISCARFVGLGDKNAADQAAVASMRKLFNDIPFSGTIVIGEGERDEAPMLFIGEKVGGGNGTKIDIAVDPLECTNSVAFGRPNAISVLAAGPDGCLLHAPDTYMDKIAVGPKAADAIDIHAQVAENLKQIADALNKEIKDLMVVVLDRPRHEKLVGEIRAAGARITLIPDGDISGAIAPSIEGSGIDVLMGVGAAPEGVIAAAALKCLGGNMQGILKPRNEEEIERAKKMGVKDLNKVFEIDDLAKGDNLMFAATGVTDGPMLKGINFTSFGAVSHSMVMRSRSGTVRFIESRHVFEKEPKY
ncbi:MAG: class II fructose-bisphosphatase [Candidatus Diapherotrites archaeon]|nr:class II fructose-bisphosphatase [Candidatus Diapherotrites archaeon]